MKLSVLLVLFTLFQASAEAIAQDVSINVKNASLTSVFKTIKKQTGYDFLYLSSDIEKSQPVTIHVEKESVANVLEACFQQQPLSYEIKNTTVLVRKKELFNFLHKPNDPEPKPQQREISGRVTDAAGQPLQGVTVSVTNSSVAVMTDDAGHFRIRVGDDATALNFSLLGHIDEQTTLSGRNTYSVVLQQLVSDLDEVVVVGYGSQKRSDITGAISSVSSKSLREVPVTSAPQMLQGTVAGVQVLSAGNKPGDGVMVQIRGKRSFNAGNDPLYVIDGFPVADGLNELNPNDIASMEILKDASATAIYGSRGANGVIIITTKRGAAGKTTISYDNYLGLSKIMDYVNFMDGPEFAEYKRESRRSVINPATGRPTYDDDDPDADALLFTEKVELESIQLGRTTDWQRYLIQNGFIQNHSLGISGGTENTRFNLALGYFNDNGIIKNQDFTRYTTRVNLDQRLGPRVQVGLSSLASYGIQNEGSNPYGEALYQSPLGVPYDEAGNLVHWPNNDNRRFNPLADLVDGAVVNRTNRFRLLSNLFGEVDIVDGLKFRVNFGVDLINGRTGTFYGRYTIARATGDPSAGQAESFRFSPTLENILTYNKVFAGKHSLNFTGLYSLQSSTFETSELEVVGLPVEAMEHYNFGAATTINEVGSSYQKWGIASYMARINYSYDNRFLVTLTGRADGSSKFAKGHQWGYFPSTAIAWNIINEGFLRDNNTFSNLKLRVSYGETGNEGIAPYQTNGLLNRTQYDFDGEPAYGYSPSTIGNRDLRWESTASLNAGLDFGVLGGRLTGTFEVYRSNTHDLLLPRVLPSTSGYSSILTNVGSKRNTGVEVTLSSINITPKNPGGFEWSTDLNLFTNKEEITELSQGKVDDIGNARFIGHPATVFYDYVKLGIWQLGEEEAARKANSYVGQIKVADLNNNGVIDPGDRKILGADVPRLVGGMTHRFGYKGFDLAVLTFARFGSTIQSPMHSGGYIALAGKYNSLDVDYWTKDNPTNAYPQPNSTQEQPLYGSTLGYFGGTFVKIRNINLGYNFSNQLVEKIKAQSLRIYISAQNPFVFSSYTSKYNGIDPENPTTNTPVSRVFLAGINVKF